MSELTDSRTKRSFIGWLIDSKSKEIDYWLDAEDSKEKIDNWLPL